MTGIRTAVETLSAVEQPRGVIPYLAQGIDVETVLEVALLQGNGACGRIGLADDSETDACLFEGSLELLVVLIGHLHDDTGILGQEHLHHIIAGKVVQRDVHTACGVGKTHLQQCGDHTTCADVVASHDDPLLDQSLQGIEGITEVFRIAHRGHIIAHLAQALCEGTTAKTLLAEGEVDMIEGGFVAVDHHG